MKTKFNAKTGLIIVQARVIGPTGTATVTLGVDTGATSTLISIGPLIAAGYDPNLAPDHVDVATGAGVIHVPRIPLSRISALGHDLSDFPVLCHTLPASAGVDGLLGLDFMRGRVLTIDFQNGQITLQ
jgi:predicted aspartyl protease